MWIDPTDRIALPFAALHGSLAAPRAGKYLSLVLALCASNTILAQSTPAKRGVDVILKTVTEEAIQGELRELSSQRGLLLRTADGRDLQMPIEDVVLIYTDKTVSPRGRRGFTFFLTNGDRLYGTVSAGRDEGVEVETRDLGRLFLPLESIARIDAARADTSAYRAAVEWFDRRGAPAGSVEEDRILVTNGDMIRGLVTGVDADGIRIEADWDETSSPRETIVPHRLTVAVRLASPPPASPAGLHYLLTLRNSGRLTVTDLRWSAAGVRALPVVFQSSKAALQPIEAMAPSPDGQRAVPSSIAPNPLPTPTEPRRRLRIEAERIARLEVIGGRWQSLSRRRPISYQHTPMLSLGWEYVNDRNVLGGPLRVAGNGFRHGIGVHSRSVLVYDLQGKYEQFVTSFGIDDDSGPYADVTVSIRVDGRAGFEEPHVRAGRLYGPVRLDVRGADRIELIADFGDNGDLQDRLDWLDPALIRP